MSQCSFSPSFGSPPFSPCHPRFSFRHPLLSLHPSLSNLLPLSLSEGPCELQANLNRTHFQDSFPPSHLLLISYLNEFLFVLSSPDSMLSAASLLNVASSPCLFAQKRLQRSWFPDLKSLPAVQHGRKCSCKTNVALVISAFIQRSGSFVEVEGSTFLGPLLTLTYHNIKCIKGAIFAIQDN